MQEREHPRYAVYYVPAPGTKLAGLGCAVLGYGADSGKDVPFLDTLGLTSDAWAEATREPRRYGFHATFKAPFRLKDGLSEDEFVAAVQRVALLLQTVCIDRLTVKALTRFVALVPAEPSPAVDRLAWRVVNELDWARAPLTNRERERRLAAGLSERQRGYLEVYGYPYVEEEFRFHLTIAGPLSPELMPRVQQRLAALFSDANLSCFIDALTVLRQDDAATRFRVISRCPLGSQQDEATRR